MNQPLDFDAWLTRKRTLDMAMEQHRKEKFAIFRGCLWGILIYAVAIGMAWWVTGWVR